MQLEKLETIKLENIVPYARNPRKNQDIDKKRLYGKIMKIATINVKGLKRLGMREMKEYWMKKNNIDILVLQETQIKQNTKENRKDHTWYFSG